MSDEPRMFEVRCGMQLEDGEPEAWFVAERFGETVADYEGDEAVRVMLNAKRAMEEYGDGGGGSDFRVDDVLD